MSFTRSLRTVGYLDFAKHHVVKTIVRPYDSGIETGLMQIPFPSLDDFQKAFKEGSAQQLTDYLWEHGMNRISMAAAGSPKEAWSLHTAMDYVARPLVRLIERLTVTVIVEGRGPAQLAPNEGELQSLAAQVAEAVCGRRQRARAVFYHRGLIWNETEHLTLVDGISVQRWDTRSYCLFLSLYGADLFGNVSILPTMTGSCVEIAMDFDLGIEFPEIVQRLAIRVSQFRLALTLLEPWLWSVGEGSFAVVLESPLGTREVIRINRDEQSAWSSLQLTPQHIIGLRDKIEALERGFSSLGDLGQILWRFERACVLPLPMDKLVEAVIGLESLLVPGAGDSRYRFGLHGAAILCGAGEDPSSTAKQLRQLYDARSGQVHGGRRRQKDGPGFGEAIVYLARAVERVISLQNEGTLPPGNSIAERVERLVLLRAASATSK